MRAQRFMGIVALACATGLAFVAIVYGPPWWARTIVFLPLWLAGVALLPPRKQRRSTAIAAVITAALMLVR